MLTVIILSAAAGELRLHAKTAGSKSIKKKRLRLMVVCLLQASNLTLKTTKGLVVANKII